MASDPIGVHSFQRGMKGGSGLERAAGGTAHQGGISVKIARVSHPGTAVETVHVLSDQGELAADPHVAGSFEACQGAVAALRRVRGEEETVAKSDSMSG